MVVSIRIVQGYPAVSTPPPFGVKPVLLTVKIFAVYLRVVVNDVSVQ